MNTKTSLYDFRDRYIERVYLKSKKAREDIDKEKCGWRKREGWGQERETETYPYHFRDRYVYYISEEERESR